MALKRHLESTVSGYKVLFEKERPSDVYDDKDFDSGFEDGMYVDPAHDVTYDFKAAMKYCKDHGINPEDLSATEMKQFEI
ncbi:hypothetical protein CBW65_01980 [Tumebacillus avium]|uniref:Uncharacterized protein n=1 Tax=Tumebacillus avium TaxID=1903704 RepID=A0A1Y0IKB4_9BACL|nr:hypothetical protein [Tumebacillus avium]ARU59965.1 hypothetical protein CBW65_01980 [Tumebacillus avium]